LGPSRREIGRQHKKDLRLCAVNIVAKQPFLDGVEPENKVSVILAVELLEVIRGTDRLKLSGLTARDLTAREFQLVSYLALQIDTLGAKGKASRG
jgi:hypothetical protein